MSGINKVVFSLLMIFSPLLTSAQASLEARVLTALTYIQYNPNVFSQLKKTFPYLTKRRDRVVPYEVNTFVEFNTIYFFSYKLPKDKIPLPIDLIEDQDLYKKEFFFTRYSPDFLQQIPRKEQAKINLTFSQPVKNFLVAEFLDKDANISSIKMGPALQLLFVFAPSGLIEEVYFASPVFH